MPDSPTNYNLPSRESSPQKHSSGSQDQIQYAALVSYIGTRYCGWQIQNKTEVASPLTSPHPTSEISIQGTVQGTIQKTLSQITQTPVSIVGSGRTDAGVHASGQVFHFFLTPKKNRTWSTEVLLTALNSLLPLDIRILKILHAPDGFHAQFSAIKKQYSYYFLEGPCSLPAYTPLATWVKKPLNKEAMQEGINSLIGTHDFKPFQASGANTKTTTRQILEAEMEYLPLTSPGLATTSALHRDFRLVRLRVVGTGFLKQMVRSIAGTALQVGENKRDSCCFKEILESKDRKQVGPTASERGLWLERVHYADLDFDRPVISP